MQLVITSYDHERTNRAAAHEQILWADFAARLVEHDERPHKSGPCYVAGDCVDPRADANVRSISGLTIDLDNVREDQVLQVFQALKPYHFAVHSTHGHAPPKINKFRFFIPLKESMDPKFFYDAWDRLNGTIGNLNDPATRNPSRLNYYPSCPHKGTSEAFIHEGKGYMALEGLKASEGPSKPREAESRNPSFQVDKVRKRLKRVRAGEPIKPLAQNLLEGVSISEPGDCHQAILELTMWIGDRFPELSPDAIKMLFAQSFASTPHRKIDPTEAVKAYQSYVAKKSEERQKKAERPRKLQLEVGEAGGIYSSDHIAHIAEMQGCAVSQLRHRWIIQRGASYFFLDAEGLYQGPYTSHDARPAAAHILARAPIELNEATQTGVSRKGIGVLVEDYGSIAKEIVSDLTLQRSYFDPETKIFHEAVCPTVEVEHEYSEEIDQWLNYLSGEKYPLLCRWISYVPQTSQALSALYLSGPPSCGKTLLPIGLAQMWGTTPSDPGALTGSFNEELARCPLILADEALPKSHRGLPMSAAIRSELSRSTRQLKRKYLAPTTLCGNIRLVITANNESILENEGVATPDDLKAIQKRFLYIQASQNAANYLSSLLARDVGKNEKQSYLQREWLTRGLLKRHLAWIVKQYQVTATDRFAVEDDGDEMHLSLLVANSWNAWVITWLTNYLMEPTRFDQTNTEMIVRKGGSLFVNTQAIVDAWSTYLKQNTSPDSTKIATALHAISFGQKRFAPPSGGPRKRYWEINPKYLFEYASKKLVGDADVMAANLAEDSAGGVVSFYKKGKKNNEQVSQG